MSAKKDVKGLDAQLLRRIITYLVPYKGWVSLAFVSVLTAAYLGPLRPKIVQTIIDRDIANGDVDGLQKMIMVLIIILVAEGVLSLVNAYLTQWIGQRAIYDLRTRVYRHIQRQSLAFFDKTPIGKLITRVTSDVESLSQVLSAGIVMIVGDLFKLIFISYFMFTLSPVLAGVTLAVMPLMLYATFWFKRKVRDQYRETRAQVAKLNSFLAEHVSGMRVVQIFGREKEELRRFTEINNNHRAAHLKTIFYFALFWPAIDLVASTALGLVMWFGGLQAMAGTLTLGILIAFVQYARQFFEPIRNLSDQFNTLQSAMAGAERIFDVLDTDTSIKMRDTGVALPEFAGHLEFKDVWFSYKTDIEGAGVENGAAVSDTSEGNGSTSGARFTPPADSPDWILKGVSFSVKAGESLAIVGATGAGKTTIISLVLRFYDIQHGTILLDGVDVRDIPLQILRQQFGLVLQDVFLFSGSIADNISLGNPDISRAQIMSAVRSIGAESFVESLPDGYDHVVRERGMSLSHGQRQLLSFVRALVYDPRMLVLDEATSSVDTQTEETVQRALTKLMSGRTTIVIAHRLSTIQHADQILVMHKGQVRESGTHQALLGQDGLYRRLYELQYSDQEAA
jgi:ATP-binding cassette, subfamily B, multidrug efflux pump